jgi:regulatory protein
LSLKARAIGLLAQREHSRSELRRKLLNAEAQAARRAVAQAAERNRASDHALAGFDEQGGAPADDEPHGAATGSAGSAAERIDRLLDDLTASGYLSEERFVESRLHARAGRFGADRIRQELAQHGLRLNPEQHEALRNSEFERALDVWQRRFGHLAVDAADAARDGEPAADPTAAAAERARQGRFLLARGFAAEVVRRVLRSRG